MLKLPSNGVIALTPIGQSRSNVQIKNNLELSNSGQNYATARANVGILSGIWYWEVKIKSGSNGRIGICTEKCQPESVYAGLGDDLESWSYDGYQSSKYHNENDNNYSESYGESWKTGDVVGCLYDADAKKITFFKNGKNLGVAFTLSKVDEVYPAASVYRGTVFEFNFSRKWQYPVKNAFPIQYQLSASEVKSITQIFDKYFTIGVKLSESGNTGDVIKGMGLMQLAKDLGSKGDYDPLLFILVWKLHCRGLWEISKEEWITGLQLYNCSTLDQLKARVDEWQKELKNSPESFNSFYNFVFDYLKPEKATALDKDEALMAWTMLDIKGRWKLWDKWEKFLKENSTVKSIPKDTWQLLLSFIDQVNDNLKNYDPNDCWPIAIDDFVDFVKSSESSS